MNNTIGLTIARQKTQYYEKYGTEVKFAEQYLRAKRVDDLHEIARFASVDGLIGMQKRPILFELPGCLFTPDSPVQHGVVFTCAGVSYTVETLHEQMRQDVCTHLVLVAYKND